MWALGYDIVTGIPDAGTSSGTQTYLDSNGNTVTLDLATGNFTVTPPPQPATPVGTPPASSPQPPPTNYLLWLGVGLAGVAILVLTSR